MMISRVIFLTLLFGAFVVAFALGIWLALSPPTYSPVKLRVSSTSGPFSRDIFVQPSQINELLQFPSIHRVFDVNERQKGTSAKLSLPNTTVFLPSATSLNQTLTFLPLPQNNPNTSLQAKLVGPMAEQYFLRFSDPLKPSILISEANGSGGFRWKKSTASSNNLRTAGEGGGFLAEDPAGLVEFLTNISEQAGSLETLFALAVEWLNDDPPAAITNEDIIEDMTQVLQTFIVAQQAAQLQTNWDNLQIPLAITIPTTVSALGLDKPYTDATVTGDPHGVLSGGFVARTTTFNLASNLADANGATGTYTFANTMIQYANALNFSNTSGQPTQPSEFWLAYAQSIAYYIYMIQLAALYDTSFGVGSTYPAPWTSARLLQAQEFLAGQATPSAGLAQAYELYYQFRNQFQANIAWEEVPADDVGDSYCLTRTIIPSDPPQIEYDGCAIEPIPFYSIVNGNGSKLQPPPGGNIPACAVADVPSNVVGSADGQGQYTCQTATDSAALDFVRTSYTVWLEQLFGNPLGMLDSFARVTGLSCSSFSSNVEWSCTALPSTFVENGKTITSGFWFGVDNGSASSSLSADGVHLHCSTATSVTMLTSVFYDSFTFEVESFSTFSQSAFDDWNPSFTTNGGCCPPNTTAIRTCWEGSITESVGSQSSGVVGRRKFWCVTDTINNNVTTSTDAALVIPCVDAQNSATLFAGLFPFAQTPNDMADFSCFFMPSRAQQWFFSSTNSPPSGSGVQAGFGWGSYNIFPSLSGLNLNLYAYLPGNAAAEVDPNASDLCAASAESQSNVGGVLAPLASQSGFPLATSTAAVPQLMAYAFPTTNITGTWIIPTLTGTNVAQLTDGTKTVQLQSVDAINAILAMPQPNFAASTSGAKLWGMPSPSVTTAINPWVAGTSIVFWNQDKTVLAPGTTVSASSSVTAIVLENQYTQVSGTPGTGENCYNAPSSFWSVPSVLQGCQALFGGAQGCGVYSAFNGFDWTGYSEASLPFVSINPQGTVNSGTFSAPSKWRLSFVYSLPS